MTSRSEVRGISPWLIVLPALCVAVLLGSLIGGASASNSDFHAFYESARAWRDGRPLYDAFPDRPNHNTPILAILLAPLTGLPLNVAFLLWSIAGLALMLDLAHRISETSSLSPARYTFAVVAMTLTSVATTTWHEGQVSWFLAYGVGRAWLCWKERPRAAAAWLGAVTAIKPPLLIALLLLPWPLGLTSTLAAVVFVTLSLPMVGARAWTSWLALARQPLTLSWPINASLFGLAARAQGRPIGEHLAWIALGWCALALIALAATAIVILVLRQSADSRWSCAILASVLLSPAGSSYTLAPAAGPLMRSWPTSRISLVGFVLLCVPMSVMSLISSRTPDLEPFVTSAYGIATLLLFVATTRSKPPGGT